MRFFYNQGPTPNHMDTRLPPFFLFCTLFPILQGFLGWGTGDFRTLQYGLVLTLGYHLFRMRHRISYLKIPGRSSIWISFGLLFLASSWSRFFSLRLNGIDFSIFDWMLVNTTRGHFMYSPLNELNHFAVHPSWILLPLAPLHGIFQSPLFLLTMGPLAIWLASYFLWKLCKLSLCEVDAGIVTLAFLTTPFVGTVVNAGFRIESFFPLFLFGFLYFWETKQRIKWILFATLFVSIKEDAPLYLGAFATAELVIPSRRKEALCLLMGNLAFFLATVGYIQPFFAPAGGTEPEYLRFWGHYGSTKAEILSTMVKEPQRVLSDIWYSGWAKLYLPLGFLPLLSRRSLFTSMPGIVLLGTAASYPVMHQYQQYYPFLLTAIALYGMRNQLQAPRPIWFIWFIRISLLLFPLLYAGSLRVSPPNRKALEDLQQARLFLEASHKEAPICVQPITFPYLGYRLQMTTLKESCLSNPDSVIVLMPSQDPYPDSKESLQKKSREFSETRKAMALGAVQLFLPIFP